MSKVDKSDPFPSLPRRRLFVDEVTGTVLPERRWARAEDVPGFSRNEILEEMVASALPEAALTPVTRVLEEKRRGRPAVVGRPWEAEGISRALWYRRRKERE